MGRSNNHLVIMAGGIGSRFWPMSTSERPKQFIDVLGVGKSLLQLTYERFSGFDPKNIWVITNQRYVGLVHQQLPDVPFENILQEPCRRNTAPCIAYVSWRIKSIDPKANVVVSPSDHIVTDVEEFRRIIKLCMDFTQDSDAIVTLGMKPNRPETGYGYIKADLSMNSLRQKQIYRVDKFKEKPSLEKAQEYIKESDYFWNAGIFIWSVSSIVNAFRVYQPAISKIFENLLSVYGKKEEQEFINKVYPECENISVDYAIMERVEEIFVCPADFGWSDLGTWGSLQMQAKHDLYGNTLIGNKIDMYECNNCIVHTLQQKQVVIQGLDNYIVAEKDGILLICKLSEEQRIRQFSGEG